MAVWCSWSLPLPVSIWGVRSQFASPCTRPVAPASRKAIRLDLHPWKAPTARGLGAGPGPGGWPREGRNVNGKLIYSVSEMELGVY